MRRRCFKPKLIYIYFSEAIGTAFLVGVGLSIVILNNGAGAPVTSYIPDPSARRAITGFLFGATGCVIALSPIGRISGAHINPIVSFAFWLRKRIFTRHLLGYVVAQLVGSVAGSLPLLLWGKWGDSIGYGNTVPGPGRTAAAFVGETVTSFLLVTGIFFFCGHRKLRRFTPYLMPPLYGLMVWAEGALSGTSTNPARSFGPAVVSGVWTGWWLYWLAPLTGAVLAVWLFRLPGLKWWKVLPKLRHRGRAARPKNASLRPWPED
ncbi:MAG TPA: MIP/aquaporin family protein [Puia sp.]|nr:MIP/aquaporin family protein [Puia sp.]